MVKYQCENPLVETCFKTLVSQVTDAGGWFHDGLVICEQGGGLHLESTLDQAAEEILAFIPEKSLLSLDLVHVDLNDDELSLSNPAPEVTEENHAIFQTLIELYNLTGKIKDHKNHYPWVVMAKDQETMRRLIAGRPNLDFIPAFKTDLETGKLNDLVLKSYFKTRILKLDENRHMLVPVIDCTNHHHKANSFKYASQSMEVKNIGLLNSRCVPKSNETFIRYGFYDAFDLFMNYGFASDGADFVRSVPVNLNLDGFGEILTNAFSGLEYQGAMPEHLENFRFHTPIVMTNNPGTIEVSHLVIPHPDNIDVLKSIVAGLIRALAPTAAGNDMAGVVDSAISQIVATNRGFYQNLKTYLSGMTGDPVTEPVINTAIKMADIQLANLADYS